MLYFSGEKEKYFAYFTWQLKKSNKHNQRTNLIQIYG
jgi:hypothetical protein